MKPTIFAATIFTAMLLALVVVRSATALVPPLISYQGVLTDNAGTLVPDGPQDFTFSIWDAEVGGNLLYCETQTGVQVVKGGFSVRIGEGTLCAPMVTLASVPFDGQYWFQVVVGAGPALSRVKFTAAPYTLMAKTVLPNAITGSQVLDGSLAGADIADGSISAIDIGPDIVSSINGVTNDGGTVSIVAGPGLSIVPDDITNTVTVNRQAPIFYTSGSLGAVPITATTTSTKIADYLTFTKASSSSVLPQRSISPRSRRAV
jgi:hypothetical protein